MPTPHVDITGLMVKPIDGWQERVEKLCKPHCFDFAVWTKGLYDELSREEWNRLQIKLRLVETYAKYMAVGMLKGVLKYSNDDWTVDQWMAHLIGEGADKANYDMLLFSKWASEHNPRD